MRRLNEPLATLIRSTRIRLGYTQASFAEAVEASQQSVSRWEGGDVPPMAALVRVSQVLAIPIATLTALVEPRPASLSSRVRDLEDYCQALGTELAKLKADAGQLDDDTEGN